MKPFPPTLREHRRYVQFVLEADTSPSKGEVSKALSNAVLGLIGTKGMAEASFLVVEYDPKAKRGIVRSTDVQLDNVMAALALVSEMGGKPASVGVMAVSGTLKTLRERP